MFKNTIIRKKSYFDSVTLMSLTAEIKKISGVEEVVIAMATEMNLDILVANGLTTNETKNSEPNDLIIAYILGDESQEELVIESINRGLAPKKITDDKTELNFSTIHAAQEHANANIVVISAPGEYASMEAMIALRENLHVMLFSDNVTVEEEVELKEYARKKGLLMMGPDCGTSIINNVGLCFANNVNTGNIGLVGASGTGLQEVTVLIDKYGGGISHAIGVGGRDLSEKVGGIMMIESIKALAQDEKTEIIVLISKPPHISVRKKIMNLLEQINKPVVINFLDDQESEKSSKYYFTSELNEAAKTAVSLSGNINSTDNENYHQELDYSFIKEQEYLIGLYCGGTLCAEALSIGRKYLNIKSNVAKNKNEKLLDPFISEGHTLVDLGDDNFTNGRPHPMIEPSIRLERIIEEASKKTTKVIFLDFELGFGSHNDPVGVTIPTIIEAQSIAKSQNREVAFVAYVLGTDHDFQNKKEQEQKLIDAGVLVGQSHSDAIKLALKITGGGSNVGL